MANRFPLVLDTTDGNKIKELPSTDDLDLTDSNIVNVQDITSVGTIRTQELFVRGSSIDPVNLLELEDSPSSYTGAAGYFLKVNSAGDGIEFAALGSIGTIQVADLISTSNVVPETTNTGQIGTTDKKWSKVIASQLIGDLVTDSGSIVFDSSTGYVSYAALQGAPTFLSEFTDDVGFLRTADLDSSLGSLFSSDAFDSDIQGSVFGDDSTVLVDGVNSEIVGDVNNSTTTSVVINAGVGDITTLNVNLDLILTGSRTTGLTIESTSNISGDGGLILVTDGSSTEEEIKLQPAGADGKIKFQASAIQFVGDVTTGISASGGFTGDLTGSVVSDNSTVIIDGVAGKIVSPNVTGTANFENDVVVTGNLTVNGTTTTVNSNQLDIGDSIILLNGDEVGVPSQEGGIEIERGTSNNARFIWNEASDTWSPELYDGAAWNTTTLTASEFIGPVTGDITGDTAGTHTGPVVGDVTGNAAGAHTGTFDGEVTGSVFGDDSTILVDGVAGKIVGYVDNAEVVTTTVQGRDSEALNIYRGAGGTVSLGDASSGDVSVSDSGINITSTAGVDIDGAATGTVNIGTGVTTGNVTIGKVGNTTTIDGTFNAILTGNVIGDVTGNVTGNIDQATVEIGATTATAINIGNAGSTTTIQGILSSPAVVSGNITADDSMQITTAVGTNNGITLNPQGTNTSVNLQADAIRTFGSPFTDVITAQGGITGDVKGSVVGDDSTILIDAVNSNIPKANIQDSTNWDTAFSWGNHASSGYVTSVSLSTAGNTGTGSVDISGAEVLTVVGTTNQINVEASAFALSFSLANVIETDLQGSVFADDSSMIIDGVSGTIVGPISKIVGDVQQISGPGAISLDTLITEITTTGTDDAYTLADGILGQIKIIAMVGDSGDAILTPTTFANGTNVTFEDVNDNITLLFTSNGWLSTANQGNPVIA